MLPVAVARSPFEVTSTRYVLPVLSMTSCFSYDAESKTTRMFPSARQMVAPVRRQTTLFGRDRQVRYASSCHPHNKCLMFCGGEGPFDNDDSIHNRVLQTVYRQLTGAKVDCPRYGAQWEQIGFQGLTLLLFFFVFVLKRDICCCFTLAASSSKRNVAVGLPPVPDFLGCSGFAPCCPASRQDQPRDAKCPGFQGAVKMSTTIIIIVII